MLTRDDLPALACPMCRGAIRGGAELRGAHEIRDGYLDCEQCGRAWPVTGGIAELLDMDSMRGSDAWLRLVYDVVAPWHDLGVTLALPWMQFPDFGASRDRYMNRVELGALERRRDGEPVRVLEVGVGSGGNLPLVVRDLPADLDVEIWGLDYSRVMLFECRRRLPWYTTRPVRLVLGDAHRLPFRNGAFDRVFHVGGINGYADARAALAEMARVARPDTPIVVVDEQLDPGRVHLPHHYAYYWALTCLNTISGPPTGSLPPGATQVEVRPVSRFYYCLTFRMTAQSRAEEDGTNLRAPAPTGNGPESGTSENDSSEGDTTMALSALELQTIRNAYDEGTMNGVLRYRFDRDYPATDAWLDALTAAFATNLPAECPVQPRDRLSAIDRERCLVALLCSRGEKGTLGIHIYMALCLGVEEEEIKHILFLAGVYAGVPNFARGLIVLEQAVGAIKAECSRSTVDPGSMTAAILAACGV